MLACDVWHGLVITDHASYSTYWRILDSHEQTQAKKFSNPLLHQRYVVVHGRLRLILAHYLNVHAKSIRIEKAIHGKPYLTDYLELAFNLSHTRDVMAVAVAKNCQLGVDVEHCKPRTNLAALVSKCFSDKEAAYWQQLPAAQQQQAFYQFWTRKEAFVKATGFGIAVGLRDCVLNPENPQHFLAVPTVCGTAHRWQCRDVILGQDLCAALVADKTITTINVRNAFP